MILLINFSSILPSNVFAEIAQGRLYQTEEDKPDKVQFCNWRELSNCSWNYKVCTGSSNGDSGVAMTWNEAPLAPDESREYVTSMV